MPWTPPNRKVYIPSHLPKKINRKLLGRAIYLTLKNEGKRPSLKRTLHEAKTNDLYCRAALANSQIMQTYQSL